jgi:excisionase family DNA binding protein
VNEAQAPPVIEARLLSVDECARALGISAGLVKRLISTGELKSSKLFGRRLVAVKDLDVLVEAFRAGELQAGL